MSLLHARHCAKDKNWLGFILCPATYIVGYLIIESPIIFKKFLSHLFSHFFPFLTLSYAFKFFPKKITSDSILHPWYCTWILFSCYQIHKTFAFGHRPLSWCSSRTSWTFYGSILTHPWLSGIALAPDFLCYPIGTFWSTMRPSLCTTHEPCSHSLLCSRCFMRWSFTLLKEKLLL